MKQSAGYTNLGDAQIVGSIVGNVLTVTEVVSGLLAPASVLSGPQITGSLSIVSQTSGETGGVGTYTVNAPQTAASDDILAQGSGTRVPAFKIFAGVTMQVQPLSSGDIKHLDSLNISGVLRAVYINGQLQSLVRAAVKGGDILLIPTGLTGAAVDTWLVVESSEGWDAEG